MITPDDVDDQYKAQKTSPIRKIRKAWLMGTIEDTDALTVAHELPEHRKSRDACAYVIETDNEKTIELLRGIKDFGVSSENPYLQDPDFESKKGAIKWGGDRQTKGKLFLNGQVMDYEDKTTDELVFPGPTGVTVRLNNVDYPMSIDRPPIKCSELETYTEALLKGESQAVLVQQLKASEHLWHLPSKEYGNFGGTSGYNTVVKSIIKNLMPSLFTYSKDKDKKPPYTYDDFKAVFGDNYVCAERYTTTREEIIEAENKGYKVCLDQFSKLGVPSIKDVIDSSARLKEKRPYESLFVDSIKGRYSLGTSVLYERLKEGKEGLNPEVFLNKFPDVSKKVFVDGNRIKIVFDVPAGEDLLLDDLTERDESNIAENIIYSCRGLLVSGIRTELFDQKTTSMTIDGRVMTFGFIAGKVAGKKNSGILIGQIPEIKTIDQGCRNQIIVEFKLTDDEDVKKWEDVKTDLAVEDKKTISEKKEKPNDVEKKDESSLVVPESETTNPDLENERLATTDAGDAETNKRKKELREALAMISEVNPEDRAIIGTNSEVTFVPVTISDENVKKFKEVQKVIPHLEDMVNTLEEVSKSDEVVPLTAREELMVQWLKNNGNKLLNAPSSKTEGVDEGDNSTSLAVESYLRPNILVLSLAHILEVNNQADIPVSVPAIGDEKTMKVVTEAVKLESVGKRIESVAKKFIPDAKDLENFELITSPSQEQLKKLTLLKTIMSTMGYEANNDLFVFKGNNVKGFNLDQKAIGLHEAVLNVEFQEAFAVFRHEIAHNRVMSHGAEFIATDEAIASHVITNLGLAANRLLDLQLSLMKRGMTAEQIEKEISTKHTSDFLIVNASRMWDEMGGKGFAVESK
jgi:hypothetical protein